MATRFVVVRWTSRRPHQDIPGHPPDKLGPWWTWASAARDGRGVTEGEGD